VLDGKPVVYTTDVAVPDRVERPWVGRIWAQAHVAELLEEIALGGEQEERKNEVISLALAYNFVTPYTSFLAIPENELTDAARVTLAGAREHKRRILEAHPDAAALSRSSMPPGDPLLSVRAPRDAVQVTAYFPFGLVKDLHWDAHAERWQVRFLVPKSVPDGAYQARVVVLHKDGSVELMSAPYTVDSSEPDFEVEIAPVAGGVMLSIVANEVVREAHAALVSDPSARVELGRTDGLRFGGFLALPPGPHEIRVVVADEARNEADEIIRAEVL